MGTVLWIIVLGLVAIAARSLMTGLFGGWRIKSWRRSAPVQVASWEELFEHGQTLSVAALYCGDAVCEPGYRSFLDTNSLPPDYPLDEPGTFPIFLL